MIIAFCYVLRSGKIVKGALIGWGLSIVCVFLISVVLPAVVALYDIEYASFFPDAIGVPGVMVIGWVPGLLVAVVARLVKRGIERVALDTMNRHPVTVPGIERREARGVMRKPYK